MDFAIGSITIIPNTFNNLTRMQEIHIRGVF
jgi:hypothetical protein